MYGCQLPWRSHISQHIKSLHWLPVKSRIEFKILVMVFKTIQSGHSEYLNTKLVPYMCSLNTQRGNSNNKILQTVDYDRKMHTSFQQLNFSFAYSAPRLWNNLPLELGLFDFLYTFRKKLKTHLFASIYPK